MSEMYEPESRFLERLEWQLSSEYRRANRLKSAPKKIAVPRGAMAVALMAGIMLTGVAVMKAADYVKDSWRKKIEVARAETDVTLKKAYYESTKEMLSQAEMQASKGLIRKDEVREMKLAAEKTELDVKRSLLNLEEVKKTGQVPRNELYAPKVGGRDFVSERLKIEKQEMELELKLFENHLKRLEQLAENKMVSEDQMKHFQADMESQKIKIEKIKERLELRKRFLAGELTVQTVEIQGRITIAERNLKLAETKVDTMKKEFERLKNLEAQGVVSQREITGLKGALDAAQAELKLAALELDVLKKVK
ncbi:MAG: hypothetical protein JXB26_19820 [Candidatus Aminicenantes bacterium]|nr:hypothetical protein [Candidatus Aminicenantes bacterium]